MKPNYKKTARGAAFFFCLAAVTWYLIGKEYSLKEITSALNQADIFWLVPAVLAMVLFIFCEGVNIGRSLSLFGHNVKMKDKLKYALAGFFFSAVTPSASGGQPMQIWYMYRDGIPVSHSSLSLLIELASFQTITSLAALTGFLLEKDYIFSVSGGIRWLIFLGIGLNLLLLCLLAAAIFSRKAIKWLLAVILIAAGFLVPAHIKSLRRKLLSWAGEYRKSACYFRKNSLLTGKILLTALVQLLAFFSIPYFIYQSLGLSEYSYLTLTSIQAVLYVSVSSLPLPGAVGITEGGFAVLFGGIFPAASMGCAIILSRSAGFYLPVILSGIFIFFAGITRKNS